jgi:hypothetical protein
MFGSSGERDWDLLLQRLTSVVDDMQAAGLAALSGQAELDVLRQLETQKNRIPTVEHRLIADVDARGTAREHGCAGTAVPASTAAPVPRCCWASCCGSPPVRPAPGSRPRPTWGRGAG